MVVISVIVTGDLCNVGTEVLKEEEALLVASYVSHSVLLGPPSGGVAGLDLSGGGVAGLDLSGGGVATLDHPGSGVAVGRKEAHVQIPHNWALVGCLRVIPLEEL